MQVRRLLLWMLVCLIPTGGFAAPSVVASVAPVHSLVQGVMQGVGEAGLLFPAATSPHGASLTPSMARRVAEADVVVWISPGFEQALARILEANRIGFDSDRSLTLATAAEMLILDARDAGAAHLPHGNESQQGEHESEHEHGHEQEPAAAPHAIDFHLWLSPQNAKGITEAVATRLAMLDPQNAKLYVANAQRMAVKIDAAAANVRERLAATAIQGWFAYHDAYQYFERAFGLRPAGFVRAGPDQAPGVRRIAQLKKLVASGAVQCIFTEPQFDPGILLPLTEDASVKQITIDPVGRGLAPGETLWFTLIENLAGAFAACADSPVSQTTHSD